jgi:hypothetical protein
MIKKIFKIEVINVLQELLNNMKHSDRWGTIGNSKLLVRCTFLDPRLKAITLSSSMQQSTKNDIIELTVAVISQSRLSNVAI